MANEYQPLDINQNPMGVLQPGKSYAVEDLSSIILPESGVYRFCIYSSGPESAFKFSYPGDPIQSTVYFNDGTIEYFYLPAGTEVENLVDHTGALIVKMN